MAGSNKPNKKAKSSAAAAQKHKKKKAPAKSSVTAKSAAKSAGKAGALGSLKKMLGLGAGKKSQHKTAAKGKQTAAAHAKSGKGAKIDAKKVAMAVPGKGGKGAGKAASKAPVQQAPVGKRGRKGAAAGTGLPQTQLATSLRPKAAVVEVAPGAPVCREVACELMATTGGYCRMHYIKNWKKIKRKEMILREKKLNSYIEELVSKYPDKYIEAIRQDLANEKDFAKVIADLEIDEGLDDFETVETESAEGIIDNLKRDFDDEGDVF